MALSDIVSVTITTQATAPTRVGFGTPLIMSFHTNFPERARSYTSTAAMLLDNFLATDPAVLCAAALFSQSPRVDRVIAGREELTSVKTINLVPVPVASTDYTVLVNGLTATFTSDATPTAAEISLGLKAAIDALAENVTVTDNLGDLDIAANTVADWFSLQIVDRTLLTRTDNTLDGGIATDLADVLNFNNDWYTVHLTNHSKAVINAAAVAVEQLIKLMITSSADDDILDALSTTDIASTLQTANFARTALMYHPRPHQFAGAAWAGIALPLDPGSLTWAFKTLAGVDTTVLTDTEQTTVQNKDANVYIEIAGVSITQSGITAAAEFIDITRGVDWIRARLQENIFARLANLPKIPYTDRGVAVVEGEVRGVLQSAISRQILAADPEPVITVPLVADVAFADRAARLLPDVNFTATLAGAIHEVQISGVVSV